MDEYIEREGLINNRPEGKNPKQFGKEEYNKGWNDCRSAFYALIDDMPAADVAPVRHGRWLKGSYVCGETEWKCSSCKETEWRTSSARLKYCPFCGAKMEDSNA